MVPHPEAKVILTVRDPARWHESCLATIYRLPATIERYLPYGVR